MANNLYGCFRHETCASKDCSKIAKFWAKTMSRGHCSGDVDDVQRRFRFAQKADITGDVCICTYTFVYSLAISFEIFEYFMPRIFYYTV